MKFYTEIDGFNDNLFFKVINCNSKDVVELTWNNIKCYMDRKNQESYLKLSDGHYQTLLDRSLNNNNLEVRNRLEDLMHDYRLQ